MITYDIRIALQLPFSLGNKHATLSVSCTLSPGALLSSLIESPRLSYTTNSTISDRQKI